MLSALGNVEPASIKRFEKEVNGSSKKCESQSEL